jgi:glycolate oxidase
LAGRYNLSIANVFHAGDGNLHIAIEGKRGDEKEWTVIEEISGRMVSKALNMGGTATGELE